jgi:mannose/fructose/N-acetylgalactosamine-specific phosphotransferase system component IIC
MTVAQGFGMLFVGLGALGIIITIVYMVINKTQKNKQEEIERKEREKIYGG